jgi:hypothetical protein
MNQLNNSFKLRAIAAATALVLVAGCGGGGGGGSSPGVGTPTAAGAGTGFGGLGRGPSPVALGAAGNFVILAQSAITNIPGSAVTGDVGLSPNTGAADALTCPQVTGQIFAVDAAGPAPLCTTVDPVGLTTAISNKDTAYTDAGGRAPDYVELGAGNIGGLTLGPATYKWSTAVLVPTNVTLSGGPNDVWIFQIAQGLIVDSGVQVILTGGAQAKNVFWQTFAASDFGTTSAFKGIVISQTSIAMRTGATIEGRLLAGTAVTLQQNTVTRPL